jgi:hypothetical protein
MDDCPKHVEKSNKHIKKNCAPSWFYLQDCLQVFAFATMERSTRVLPSPEGKRPERETDHSQRRGTARTLPN